MTTVHRQQSTVHGRQGALAALVRKEALHIIRDRRTLAVLLMMPVVQVVLFGFALRTDVDEAAVAIVDMARDARSASLVAALDASTAVRVVSVGADRSAADRLVRRSEADAIVALPAGLARGLHRGDVQVQVIYDGVDPTRGRTVEAYLTGALRSWERENAPAGRRLAVVPVTRMRFNPTLASENLFVPGLLAYVLTLVSALMTAITIARERETGTMEVLLVSPLRPGQIVAAKVAPYVGLAFLNALTTLAVARVVFDVTFRGSVLLLLAESLLYVLVALAIGVLVSSRSRDQRTAMMAVLLGMLLPTMLLSGFVFPISSLPRIVQPLTNLVPTTWYIIIARGIMLKGVGLEHLWQETLVLVGMGVALLLLSARNVKARIG